MNYIRNGTKSPPIPDSNFDSNLSVEHREMVDFI